MTAHTQMPHPSPAEQVYGSIDPAEVLRRCGATFHAASLVLPCAVREDLAVLYAMCRAIDDCADVAGSGDDGRLLDDVARALRGEHDRSPLVRSFLSLARRHDVPLSLVHELIEGVRSDLGRVRLATLDELLRYSFRVASTVGLMMCRVLGVARDGDPFAIDLGIAMQLTNIARDVTEDAQNDRVYLPAEWVDPRAVLETVPGAHGSAEGAASVRAAVVKLLDEADRYYGSAELGMQFLPLTVRGGIRAAAWNYRAIGSRIRLDEAAPLAGRVRTSTHGKLARTTAAVWA